MKNKFKNKLRCIIFVVSINLFTSIVFAQDVFILDDGNASLSKTNLSTPGSRNVLASTLGRVGGMAVHSVTGDIYFTVGSNTPTSGAIHRANPDGSNLTTIASGLAFPTGLDINETTSEIYFVQNETTPTIYKVALDGQSAPVFILAGALSLGGPIDLSVDEEASTIYWTDQRGLSVRRATLSGASQEIVADGLNSQTSGIAVDTVNDKVYWIEGSTNTIRFVSTNSSFPATPQLSVTSSTIGRGGLSLDSAASPIRLFWTSFSGSIVGTALDGQTASTLLDIGDGVAGPVDVAIFLATAPTPTPTASPTPISQILSPTTVLDLPPDVTVSGKNAAITLREFTEAVQAATISRSVQDLLAATTGLTIRYDVRIKAPKKKDSRKILSKRNELTAKRLPPGNYSVNYSANAYSKKSKKQIQKAKSQGKTGFTAQFKKVYSTGFSPSANFTIVK